LPETLAEALTSKALIFATHARLYESRALVEAALALALAHDLHVAALRAYSNLADLFEQSDRWAEALTTYDRGLELARRVGDRSWASSFLCISIPALIVHGRWDEALARATEAKEIAATPFVQSALLAAVLIHCERGELEHARQLLDRHAAVGQVEEAQAVAGYAIAEARLRRAEGRGEEALTAVGRAVDFSTFGITSLLAKLATAEALEAAAAFGDADRTRELLAMLDARQPGELTPFLKALRARFRASLSAGDEEGDFSAAEALFREHELPFHLAVTQLEHAERLAGNGRRDEAEPMLTEARETFERLDAKPWIARVAAAESRQTEHAPV
jgi:tetratricopeptide (TPR) repeat protein